MDRNSQDPSIDRFGICNDANVLVMSEALLIFFPPSPPSGWTIPTAEIDTLLVYENKLDDYDDIFWTVFSTIRSNESNDSFVAGLF
ncbi:16302_t:CDS:2 [Funneliformis geosporum]|nr:16302_t:CDS:2 [Funneliformis geosporum]